MRSRLMTQVGQRLIQKVQKWVEPMEVEVRLQKDMESRGTNHDTSEETTGKDKSSRNIGARDTSLGN